MSMDIYEFILCMYKMYFASIPAWFVFRAREFRNGSCFSLFVKKIIHPFQNLLFVNCCRQNIEKIIEFKNQPVYRCLKMAFFE